MYKIKFTVLNTKCEHNTGKVFCFAFNFHIIYCIE